MVFAVGAAMGTASEFGLVLLWPNLTEAAGKYIYFPLYAEIFAFLMEVVFIYMFWYAWHKLPAKAHIVVGLLAVTGAWFSASMIMSVNSYMQAPTGIIPASYSGEGWNYDAGYPKLTLYVPAEIVAALDVEKLQSLGMDVLGKTEDSVIVAMPVKIVSTLVSEAFSGKTVDESILQLVLLEDAKKDLGGVFVKDIVDAIVMNTVRNVGIYTVTFQSPVYVASFTHTLFSGITVSAFTALGGYALAASRKRSEHAKLGLKYAATFALVSITFQGLVTGHEMGVAVAEWNPEKFAAMEVNTPEFIHGIVSFLAYGSFDKELPDYATIPDEFKPPELVHTLYYTKIALAAILFITAIVVTARVWKGKDVPEYLIILAPVAQLVSFLGWAVREIGRKPWTIYGIMDVQTAHTINPPDAATAALISLYFIALLSVLSFAVYRFLWREV